VGADVVSWSTGFAWDEVDPALAWAPPGSRATAAYGKAAEGDGRDPGSEAETCRVHLLGTDGLGRDLLVRLVYGLRVSLLVALFATALSLLLGGGLGLVSGYLGGRLDRVFLRVLEVLQSLPFLFVVILVTVALKDVLEARGSGPAARAMLQAAAVAACLGAIQWFSLARYSRSLAFSIRNAGYVRALEGMGFSPWRIVSRHLLPNCAVPLAAYATLLVPALVLEEAFLSFLGFGVQPPYPSLGLLLSDGVSAMETAPFMLVLPAAAVVLVALSANVAAGWITRRFAPVPTTGDRP